MNKYDLVRKIEEFAPLETQEKWDSSGWLVEKANIEVNKVLFALTITPKIVEQALKCGCDMIISHHPLFYLPFEYGKIDMYCAHTNLDKAIGGTTDLLLKKLDLEGNPDGEFVRVVDFGKDVSVDFLKNKLLHISPKMRYVNNNDVKTVRKVGFCAGSGSEFIDETDCDAFVTGDLKFHKAVETEKVVFDIGHFESEILAVKALKKITELSEREGIIAYEKSPFA